MTDAGRGGSGGRDPGGRENEVPRPSSGEETREILSEVLRDQAERQARQREAGQRKPRRLPLPVLTVILAVASLYVWVAAPSWILPEPLPEPTAAHLQDGLRMEMYGLVVQIERFRQENGRLPASLQEAAEDASPDVTYVPFPPESYRLQGRRASTEIVYSSGEPARTLLGDAPARIRGVAGASSS